MSDSLRSLSESHNQINGYNAQWVRRQVRLLLPRVQRMFAENRRTHYRRGLNDGMLDSQRLSRIPAGDLNVFRRRELARRRSWAVLIGVDVSGSTNQAVSVPGGWMHRYQVLALLAWAQMELLAAANIPVAVFTHSTMPDSGITPMLRLIKDFGEPVDSGVRNRLTAIKAVSGNLDGSTMRAYRAVLEAQPGTDKLMLYYTDGAMPAENYHYEVQVLMAELERMASSRHRRTNRILPVGIGLGCDDPTRYGMDTLALLGSGGIHEMDKDLATVLEGLEARLAHPEQYLLLPPRGAERQQITLRPHWA